MRLPSSAPPGQITIIRELNHQMRVIAMDQPMPSEKELTTLPYYNGHSVGPYEGDTLVIDTIGFNNKSYGDNFRTPHGDKLYVVERWRLPTTRPCGQGRFLWGTYSSRQARERPVSERRVARSRLRGDELCGQDDPRISGKSPGESWRLAPEPIAADRRRRAKRGQSRRGARTRRPGGPQHIRGTAPGPRCVLAGR
jgi:hypothetical protein